MVASKVVITLLYVALGDSITAGYGVVGPFSFPNLYANFLRRHDKALHVLNLGVDGLTTSGLLNLIKLNQSIRHCIAQASLITLTIGSNDLLCLIDSSHQRLNQAQIPVIFENMNKTLGLVGQEIRLLNPKAIVKVATLYNPLTGSGPYANYYGLVQGMIDKANAIIIAWARSFGAVVVYLDREFKGKVPLLVSQDHAHPNVLGYEVIAKAFARY